MSGTTSSTMGVPGRGRSSLRAIIPAAVLALFVAMALDTKVVKLGSSAAIDGTFSPATYGKTEFSKVQAGVETRAVDAATLAAAVAKDPAAAAKTYGVTTGGAPVFPVKFTGVVGKEDFGVDEIAVPGLRAPLKIKLQVGPAIMGTDLRDATGTIAFGQFTNQIDYQNAGSALNREMKREVLKKIDMSKLAGKTIAVVGAFTLTDPQNWLVTPVKLDVK